MCDYFSKTQLMNYLRKYEKKLKQDFIYNA